MNYAKKVMPDLVLTSDVIVGFPGETDEEFEDTMQLLEAGPCFDALFTFIFSPRGGTPAAKMDDPTPEEEKNRRFDRLLRSAERHLRGNAQCLCWQNPPLSGGRCKDRRPSHRPHRGRTAWCASPAETSMIGTYHGHHHHRRHHMEPERNKRRISAEFCTNKNRYGINIWHRQRMN